MSVREPAPAGKPITQEGIEAFLARHRRRASRYARWALAWPAALFVVISLSDVADLAADVANGVNRLHLAFELGAIALALVGVLGTGLMLRAASRDSADVLGELEIARLDLAHLRRETLEPPPR